MKKYNFPIIKNIKINHFDIYRKKKYIDIDIDKNVFCLVGANGLGKSTFITIVNYALTGIVKNPKRKFSSYGSLPKFYNDSKRFSGDYFDGRVNEDNYGLAEVVLTFTVDKYEYKIKRGFFDSDDELRAFSKKELETGQELITSDSELGDQYKKHIVSDLHLSEFAQFVFLQLHVFTFDETHQLLFWDESIMERVLYLFFGVDALKAKQADELRKKYNKYGSDARNLQSQITQTRNQLKEIENEKPTVDLNKSENIELYETHKMLLSETDNIMETLSGISEKINHTELNISDFSLKATAKRSEYEAIFNKTLNNNIQIEKNPIIIQILNDLKLRICASKEYEDLVEQLITKIRGECGNISSDKDYYQELQEIDSELSELSNKLKSAQDRRKRLIDEEAKHTQELDYKRLKIDEIEKDNDDLLRMIRSSSDEKSPLIKNYEDQIERLSTQKDKAYKERDKAKKAMEPLEKELNQGYIEAESKFIPVFNRYAKSFLGLNININLILKKDGARLSIDIGDSLRSNAYQLSESQRYFIDIALRMALIELCTQSSTILIDTPEGSLDIAYESRAGKMFADFSQGLNQSMLTANINSSQLLLELAHICKNERMQIERMTEWTELSDVQLAEIHRIEYAYDTIEKILNESK